MYETSGILNESIIKELKKYALTPKKKKFFIIFSIIYGLLGLLSIVLKDITFGIIFMCIAILGICIIFLAQYIFQKKSMDALKEFSDGNGLEIKTLFNESCVIINNLNTSSKIQIKYEYFKRFLETTNLCVLITKSGQQVFLFKNCLNEEEINSFKEFIKEKCKNIK